VEGGFLPDPHFLCSEDAAAPRSVGILLSDEDVTYSVVDINPFFNDKSSEIALLVRSHTNIFEYSIKFPRHKGVQAILGEPTPPPAKIFPYRDSLAVLVNFSGPAKGFVVLPLPLQKGMSLDLIPAGSPRFEELALALKSTVQNSELKQQFCSSTNDFKWFYEKYVGQCSEQKHYRSEIDRKFSDFWLGQ